jgi:hypothetical protein
MTQNYEINNNNNIGDPSIDNIKIEGVNKNNFNRLLNSHQYKLEFYSEFQRNIKTIKLPNNANSLNNNFLGISSAPFHLSSHRFCVTSSDGKLLRYSFCKIFVI